MQKAVKVAILLLLASCICSAAQQPSTKPSVTPASQQRTRRQDPDSDGPQDTQDPQTLQSVRPYQGSTPPPDPQLGTYFQDLGQSQDEQVKNQQLNGPQQLAGSHDVLEHQQRSSGSHRPRKFPHPRRKSSGGVPGRAGRDFPTLNAIPRTSFRCPRSRPGYFADIETGCQVFHICQTTGRKSSFLCPAGSIFNQRYLVCDWWFDTTCEVSPHNAPQTTGLDDNFISPGQGDLSLEASVYPRKPGGIHGNNVDDTTNSKPAIQQSNHNNNRHGVTFSFSFDQEHEPNNAAKFNHALTKFSAGVSQPPTEAFTVSSVNIDKSTKAHEDSHHSYQSQNFYFPHQFSTISPFQTAKPKQDQVETNSSTPYNHRPTYDSESDEEDQSTFSGRYEAGNQQVYPNQNYNERLANAQPLASRAPSYNNAPIYNLQSDPNPNQNQQYYTSEPQSLSTTLSPLTSPYPQTYNQYQSDNQNQQSNNQYPQTNNQFPQTNNQYQQTNSQYQYQQNNNQYQQNNNQYQRNNNQFQQTNNQHEQNNYQYQQTIGQYQTNSSQYPQTNQYQPNSNQYQETNNQYQQTSNQYQQADNQYGNQYKQNTTATIRSTIPTVNTTQPQQYPTYTATPPSIQLQSTNYQSPSESLHTSSSGNIHDNRQYSTAAPSVSETSPANLLTEHSFTTVPTFASSPFQYSHNPYNNAESTFSFPSTPFTEVSNDIQSPSTNYRPYNTDQTAPSTAEPSTQTTPQTIPQSTDLSPKPEVSTISPYHHETFGVTPSSPSPFTLSTTHLPPSENDLNFVTTTETPSPSTTNDDLKTPFDANSQTTFLEDANQINHALDNPVEPIDVQIDNHQSPNPTPFTFNVGQGFAQEATPTSTPTSNHFSRFIIDIPDEVTSIKSTSFGQVGNEVQSPEKHAAPSYPFTARVNDFLSAIGHHDTPAVTNSPENVTTVAVTQASPTATKDNSDESRPSTDIKVPLASSETNSPSSIVTLPFGARLRAPKRKIYRRRIVV